MSCFMDFLDDEVINDGIDGLPFQDDDEWVNDRIDGLPFQDDDDGWVNDGIDGMPFPDYDESFQKEERAERKGANNKVFAKVREFFRKK